MEKRTAAYLHSTATTPERVQRRAAPAPSPETATCQRIERLEWVFMPDPALGDYAGIKLLSLAHNGSRL